MLCCFTYQQTDFQFGMLVSSQLTQLVYKPPRRKGNVWWCEVLQKLDDYILASYPQAAHLDDLPNFCPKKWVSKLDCFFF
jgi:hypothetical protein